MKYNYKLIEVIIDGFYLLFFLDFIKYNTKFKVYEPTYRMAPVGCETNLTQKEDLNSLRWNGLIDINDHQKY